MTVNSMYNLEWNKINKLNYRQIKIFKNCPLKIITSVCVFSKCIVYDRSSKNLLLIWQFNFFSPEIFSKPVCLFISVSIVQLIRITYQ